MVRARDVLAVVLVSCFATFSLAAQRQQGAKTSATRTAAEQDVIAAEQHIWDLLARNDYRGVDAAVVGMLEVEAGGISVSEKGKVAAALTGFTTKNVRLSDIHTRMLGPDVVVLVYTANADQTVNGKPVPMPIYMMSVWQRAAGKWVPVAHSETSAAPAPASK